MAKTKLIPGFRFHPTDVELVEYFLKRKVIGKRFPVEVIAEVDIYKYAPWDLPDKSLMTSEDLEWYFFCPRAKKYGIGGRMNRSTEVGYWKTTGRDKPICHNNQTAGTMKILVFHTGRPPKGLRTDWVMHEFRLDSKNLTDKGIAQDSYVLCRVLKKGGPCPTNGGQHGKPFDEENWDDDDEDEEDEIDGLYSICIAQPLPILPNLEHNHDSNNSACECNRSTASKSSTLSLGATHHHHLVVNTDDVSDRISFNEDGMSCLLDCFTGEEHNISALNGHNNIMEKDVNSDKKKEGDGGSILLDDIFGNLEDLDNLASLDEDGLTKIGFPCTNSDGFRC